jgi:hypothetical protein
MFVISGHDVKNTHGGALWSGDHTPLVAQGAVSELCQVVQDGPLRLAVVGSCFVGKHQLREALGAVRAARWSTGAGTTRSCVTSNRVPWASPRLLGSYGPRSSRPPPAVRSQQADSRPTYPVAWTPRHWSY